VLAFGRRFSEVDFAGLEEMAQEIDVRGGEAVTGAD